MTQLATAWDRLDPAMRQRLARLPRSLRLLLENALANGAPVDCAQGFADWCEGRGAGQLVPFAPSRILMQDTAGVAALVDLAALRDRAGSELEPRVPIDLVIDHSVKVDFSGTPDAAARNLALEFERNGERYGFFKWAQQAFAGLRVVPPGNGICHQINLEQLSAIARRRPGGDGLVVPEVVIGTDSHTTMINALGVLGWGVGGLEAETAALGQTDPMPIPQVTEVRLGGALRPGVTATDAALSLTAFLRQAGVVGDFLEFSGPGAAWLSLPDRAAIANMCPEYGAMIALFAVDAETLRYMRAVGRSADEVALYEAYSRRSGLWADDGERHYTRRLNFDLAAVEPVMAGPARPQDIRPLAQVPASLPQPPDGGTGADGAVLIAAITSCTNTANPVLMLQAGLVARRARESGLRPPGWVKTSLAPGSRAMAALLESAGLLEDLAAVGFALVGFGCTTCVGNSGELTGDAQMLLADHPDLAGVAVLSGNRNFPNRIHSDVKANYLASPPLVVAAALAGTLADSLVEGPLGHDADGRPVTLADLWPREGEAEALLAQHGAGAWQVLSNRDMDLWDQLPAPTGKLFAWDPQSLALRRPPFFDGAGGTGFAPIEDAITLLLLGDGVTTDHISPIGRIAADAPAAQWLRDNGWQRADHGGYGDFRGNHEVMLRGTFDNRRLHNQLASGEGNRAIDALGRETSVFDAARSHATRGRAMIVWAGEAYGCGSARDWAAKGTALLGIRAVVARSFERIHRSNLVAMGVLPVRLTGEAPAPAAGEPISVTWVGEPGVRSTLEIAIGARNPRRLIGVAELHTADEVRILLGGGVPASLARSVR